MNKPEFLVDRALSRQEIYDMIEAERAYQNQTWGEEFDNLNTPNDWITYIVVYLGKAVTLPWDRRAFARGLIKVMALCCAALERESYAARHYDGNLPFSRRDGRVG